MNALSSSLGGWAALCARHPVKFVAVVAAATFVLSCGFAWISGEMPEAFRTSVLPHVLLNVALAIGCSYYLRRRRRKM